METPNERKILQKIDSNSIYKKDRIFNNITPMTFNTLSFLNNTDSFKKYENYNLFTITPLEKIFGKENPQNFRSFSKNMYSSDNKETEINNNIFLNVNHKLNFSNPKTVRNENLLTISKNNNSYEDNAKMEKCTNFYDCSKILDPQRNYTTEGKTNSIEIKKSKGFFHEFISGKKIINLNKSSDYNLLREANYNLNFSCISKIQNENSLLKTEADTCNKYTDQISNKFNKYIESLHLTNDSFFNRSRQSEPGSSKKKNVMISKMTKNLNNEKHILMHKRNRDSTESKFVQPNNIKQENNQDCHDKISTNTQENDGNPSFFLIEKNNDLYIHSKLSAFKLKKALFESPFISISNTKSDDKLFTNELTNKRIKNYEFLNGKTVKLNLLNILDCVEDGQEAQENPIGKENVKIYLKNHQDNLMRVLEFNEINDNKNNREACENNFFNITQNNKEKNFTEIFEPSILSSSNIGLKINKGNKNYSKAKEEDKENLLKLKKKIIFNTERNNKKKTFVNSEIQPNLKRSLMDNKEKYASISDDKFSSKERETPIKDCSINIIQGLNMKPKINNRENILNKIFEDNKNMDIDDMLNYIFDNKIQENKSKHKINNNSSIESIIGNTAIENSASEKMERTIFCTCRKTNCSKYYCFCLKNGLECGINCICKDCDNKCKKRFSRENKENIKHTNINNKNDTINQDNIKCNFDNTNSTKIPYDG